MFIAPRSVLIEVKPVTASVQIDGRPCESPCKLKLTPGSHDFVATESGFEDIRRTINVGFVGGGPPPITLTRIPEIVSEPKVAVTNSGVLVGGDAKIIVNTSLPGAQVSVDGSKAGTTGKDGRLDYVTKAGRHEVRVEKPGFLPVPPLTIELEKDKAATVFFSLTQIPSGDSAKNDSTHSASQLSGPGATPPAGSGTPSIQLPPPESFIVVKAPAGAEIHIDQQVVGHSAGGPLKSKVQPGSRTVEIFLTGFQTWKQTASVDPGKAVDLDATLIPVPVTTTTNSTPPRPAAGVSDEDRKPDSAAARPVCGCDNAKGSQTTPLGVA